ncbi:MAG TPA: AgmX/PglI C-terminal domain-containing protein [Gammaproteobacteria bacterium]
MSMEKHELRERIGRARDQLAALERELTAVDGELEARSAERHRYTLLEQVCGSLEELDRLGAAALFWGGSGNADAGVVHGARRRIERFASEIAEIEDRRRVIAGQIAAENENLGWLGEDLIDALEEEESRKAEWLVEREESTLPYRPQVMPWMRCLEEDHRFRRSLALAVSVSLLVGIVFRLVVLPVPEREELIEVPERVAQLIEERQAVPAPEPVVAEPVIEEPEPEEEPLVAEETPSELEPAAEPAPQPAQQASAQEQVRSKGILAFSESFASLAASAPSARLGSQASLSNAGEAAVGRPERAMVTTAGPGSSGGINLGDISRDFGGGGGAGQMAGVRVTQVESSIGGTGGGADRPLSGGHGAGRTDEEIQIVFDRYKAALYRLYNRELRRDPTLRGQVVVRLTIEPDGSVSMCELESSDMDAPTLVGQVLERIRGFDFGAKEGIVTMTIIYPIDFLPAA